MVQPHRGLLGDAGASLQSMLDSTAAGWPPSHR